MKQVKALFIDCDGVLYDKKHCTYEDIAVTGFQGALETCHIPFSEVLPTRAALKAQHIHGLLNAALELCHRHHVPFSDFAEAMAEHIDYSQIPKDTEMLNLLQRTGELIPTYIVTNNTHPHLKRVLSSLAGNKSPVLSDMPIFPITIEETFRKGFFHPKKVEGQFRHLCHQVGEKPEHVLVLDDTLDVCQAAISEGLQVKQIQTPEDTKQILKGVIDEKSNIKRPLSLWQTCGRFSR